MISGSSLRSQESWAPARANLSWLIIHHSPPPLEQMFIKHLHCVMYSGTRLATLTDIAMTTKGCHLFRSYSVPGTEPHALWSLSYLILPQTLWPRVIKPSSPLYRRGGGSENQEVGPPRLTPALFSSKVQSFTSTLPSIPKRGWSDGLRGMAKSWEEENKP